MSRDLHELLIHLAQAVAEASPQQAPALLGELERLKASLWGRLMTPLPALDGHSGAGEGDRLLTVEEAAHRLGVSKDFLYRKARVLPFTVRLGPRQLRFSLRGIERHIRQRQGR